jgi:hypothetical protein
LVVLSDLAQGVDRGGRGGAVRAGQVGGLHVSNAASARQRAYGDLVGVDDDVEVVRDGDAASGGDQRLGFDGLVAVSGEQQGWREPPLTE